MKVCTSCAGAEHDGAIFPEKKRGAPVLCWDCVIEQRRDGMSHKLITRAAYRAALRYRQTLDQTDLVDQIVSAP